MAKIGLFDNTNTNTTTAAPKLVKDIKNYDARDKTGIAKELDFKKYGQKLPSIIEEAKWGHFYIRYFQLEILLTQF